MRVMYTDISPGIINCHDRATCTVELGVCTLNTVVHCPLLGKDIYVAAHAASFILGPLLLVFLLQVFCTVAETAPLSYLELSGAVETAMLDHFRAYT